MYKFYLEPVVLNGEGEYNLDVVKEIEVTDSFLGLDQDAKECQDEEPYFNCTTRHYLNTVQRLCGCLPASLGFSEKVFINK